MSIATAFIDRKAFQNNINVIKKLAPNSAVIGVIKANAYGHSAIEIAKILQNQVDCLGVARLSEAILLRNAGISGRILLLEGFFLKENIELLHHYNLESVIHSDWQIDILEKSKLKKPLKIWMKIDSGMHRLGFLPVFAESSYKRLEHCKNVQKPFNLMTHFSQADEINLPKTQQQIVQFNNFVKGKPGLKSLAASSGILLWPDSHADVVRAGICMYGVSPTCNHVGSFFSLEPVMNFESEIIAIRKHFSGEPAGYGAIWKSEKDTNLAVVAVGYGDGYPRDLPPGSPVWINNHFYPLAGRVSMDMIVVDIGNSHHLNVGTRVVLWGKELPVEWIAARLKTSPYLLVTSILSRVSRVFIN